MPSRAVYTGTRRTAQTETLIANMATPSMITMGIPSPCMAMECTGQTAVPIIDMETASMTTTGTPGPNMGTALMDQMGLCAQGTGTRSIASNI